ncbi:MAG: nucleotidyl transferase AbiEii/AbiGii toxin family protein [Proteobacteria bacterium]|nr:nucleotidyl transferase AbiEii/AbiGii toxin family protein [Pseudomonadota bacterium]
MSSIFFDWSGKIDQPTINAFSALKKEADALKIPFFVMGATARDLILKHGYGIEPSRLTRDIDLGIKVAGWEQFDRLTNALIAAGRFASTREPQRFRFDDLLIDIVPFGAIGDERQRISWPPEHVIFMSVVGFDEAYESSITARLNSDPELDIRLPTLPSLALLKVISWADRYPERSKDAEDLVLIMQQYDQAGNLERLYDRERNLLAEEAFDTRLAGIRLLGRDMAMIAAPDTAAVVTEILDAETKPASPHRLIIDMIRGLPMRSEKFEEIRLQLAKLKQGFFESAKKGTRRN